MKAESIQYANCIGVCLVKSKNSYKPASSCHVSCTMTEVTGCLSTIPWARFLRARGTGGAGKEEDVVMEC